jgi:hypothetical protein
MPRTARTKHSRAEARAAVIGILSRPGTVDAMADEILAVVERIDRGPDTEPPARCRNPVDPHSGTELVGAGIDKHCPICGWRPDA